MPLISFYTPWKHQRTSGFLMFPGWRERDQWHEMGEIVTFIKMLSRNQITQFLTARIIQKQNNQNFKKWSSQYRK